MDWGAVLQQIVLGLVGVLTLVLTALVTHWAGRLRQLADSEAKANAVALVEEIIQNTVASLNQAVVDELKKEGKFDTEAAKRVKERALLEIYQQIPPATRKTLDLITSELDKTLEHWLERVVREQKQGGK